ncbi:glycosyl hydrolase family 8 [Trichlorobacter ammonificans]|uniref:cellulase n=1 Tax=Trichlorobacter ammonificans TaxID=2916410 RepID=A0ABM9D3J8_9BACT|nr:glycosyl hydrolase family 8 [Trichlorobacter ammonificans]CAH2029852.1 putative Minor endoglucanase Y [Trichlorobacter ammonificans]
MRLPRLIAEGLVALVLLLATAPAHGGDHDAAPAAALWQAYKHAFLQQDGRVIDRQQNGISHSESQGYGLLLALRYDDRPAFAAMARWTEDNLRMRRDGLLSWSWGKRVTGQWGVIDCNNATDGDLLVAYALLRGGERWQAPEYRRMGLALVRAIREHLAVTHRERTYLLPAYYGFQQEGVLVLNPSYQVFAAYRLFARVDDRSFWERVHRDSLPLVQATRSGRMKLPADWVALDANGVAPWKERPPLFGYEAIRVLLYLAWEPQPRFPEGLQELLRLYQRTGRLPASVDLKTGTFSREEASAGFYGVYALAAEKSGNGPLAAQLRARALEKAAAEKDRYYSMSLLLLALCPPEP